MFGTLKDAVFQRFLSGTVARSAPQQSETNAILQRGGEKLLLDLRQGYLDCAGKAQRRRRFRMTGDIRP
jgi:hypothetical protein